MWETYSTFSNFSWTILYYKRVLKINISLSVNCLEADERFFYMAVPTFVIGSLTALTIFVCFHIPEKSGLSGQEKSHFNAICFLCKTILSLIFLIWLTNNLRRMLKVQMDGKVLS